MAKRKRFSLNMACIYFDTFLCLVGLVSAVFGLITILTDASRITAGWIALIGGTVFAFFMVPHFWNPLEEDDE